MSGGIVRLNYAQRHVVFYNGSAELAPGILLHAAGGHSAGLQFVRVHTKRGWVVVASDVTHFYENLESGRPFVTAFPCRANARRVRCIDGAGSDAPSHRSGP